jgi:hypothetical protein
MTSITTWFQLTERGPKDGFPLFVLWSWLGSRLLFFFTLALSIQPWNLDLYLQRLGRWDAKHYLNIAIEGYKGNDFAFFPLFPYAIRLVSDLLHLSPLAVGLVLANGAFLMALLVQHQLTQHCLGSKAAKASVLLTCLNPMAIFSAVPYTESFYLLFTGLTLFSLLRRPTMAGPVGIFGGLGAATRPTGVVMVASVLVGFLRQRRLAAGLIAALLTLVGLGLVAGIGLRLKGDPLAFLHAQQAWEVRPGFNLSGLPFWLKRLSRVFLGPANTKANAIVDLAYPAMMGTSLLLAAGAWLVRRSHQNASFLASVLAFLAFWLIGGTGALCLLFTVGAFPLCAWGFRRMPLEVWVFGAASLVAYLLKQNTISLERHVFATVPLLMLYGAWFSEHPRWLIFLLGFGSLLTVLFTLRVSHGQWIG